MIELRRYKGELQYRTWLVRIDAGGAITPLPLPIEWTKWQSVRDEDTPQPPTGPGERLT